MMKAYKLMRVRKDDSIGSLFINRKDRIPMGVWLSAESHPTKGYANRKGWHATSKPTAPHLSMHGRAWFEVEINNFIPFKRPKSQGGLWWIAQEMKIVKPLKRSAFNQ